jgi:hypothetical protein
MTAAPARAWPSCSPSASEFEGQQASGRSAHGAISGPNGDQIANRRCPRHQNPPISSHNKMPRAGLEPAPPD